MTAFLRNQTLLAVLAFVVAALLCAAIALGAALVIETRSAAAITSRLMAEGFTWAQVATDGLRVTLSGTAPNEAARFRAMNLAGAIVESTRLVDAFEVTPARSVEAPRYSIEMLRNDDGIQLIGLLPEGEAEATLMAEAQGLQTDARLADMLETAAYPAPQGWPEAFAFGLAALKLLPRSKISVAAEAVTITAIAASEEEKRTFTADLNRLRPRDLKVSITISAPRPVLTPFTLRFVHDGQGARFDACSADTEAARTRILAAGVAAGVIGRPDCTIGLGVPSPSWAAAAEAGIRAVAELGDATITFSDADVTLLAGSAVSQANYDRVIGELHNALPDLFSLDATLTEKADAAPAGPAEFTAVRAPETGRVELRGRLTDDRLQTAVDSFAKARFGVDQVYVATLLDPDLPDGWPTRVLAGIEALAELDSGALVVRADTVEVTGLTGSQLARARVAQILSGKLGQGQTFKVDVTYVEALDPLAALPTPEECAERVTGVLAGGKITFDPGSAEIASSAAPLMDALAGALTDCGTVPLEIAGHTDAQGSEDGNRALSQARAEAVLVALQGRQVDVSGMRAVGYGEARPIADNAEEVGREANRRIEITLIAAASAPAPETPGAQVTPATRPLGSAEPAGADPLTTPTPDASTPDATPPQPPAPQPPAPDATSPNAAPNTGAAAPDAAATDVPAAETPDFSGDASPSLAPAEPTRRPEPRPDRNG